MNRQFLLFGNFNVKFQSLISWKKNFDAILTLIVLGRKYKDCKESKSCLFISDDKTI